MIGDFDEAALRLASTDKSFARGERYYDEGLVLTVARRGDRIEGYAQGSEPKPYRVDVSFGDGEPLAASCSCPYSWEGWCKHVVAVLLVCLREPARVETRPTLDELLEDLDREALRALVEALVERRPRLIRLLERVVPRLR